MRFTLRQHQKVVIHFTLKHSVSNFNSTNTFFMLWVSLLFFTSCPRWFTLVNILPAPMVSMHNLSRLTVSHNLCKSTQLFFSCSSKSLITSSAWSQNVYIHFCTKCIFTLLFSVFQVNKSLIPVFLVE